MRKQIKKLEMKTETVRTISTVKLLSMDDLAVAVGGARCCSKAQSGCISQA